MTLIASTLSGMAGGGGGFITAPYWLVSGMNPAQGAATGAFMSLGMGSSSLAAFKDTKYAPKQKKFIIGFLFLTLITSLAGPFFLHQISVEVFKPILAIVTIASLPLLFWKRPEIAKSYRSRIVGWVLLGIILLASSFITSSAFSIVIAIILLQAFEFTILQGTAIRRLMGIVQSAVILFILIALGSFVWQHAVAAFIGGTIGSYFGTVFAIKRGESFAKYALATISIISVILLFL